MLPFHTKVVSRLKKYIIAVIVLLQVYSLWVTFDLSYTMRERTDSYVTETAQLASTIIDQRIEQVVESLEALTRAVGDSLDKPDAYAACDDLLQRYKVAWEYSDLYLLSPDEKEIVRSIDDIKPDLPLARRAIATKKPAIGQGSLVNCITYAVPVMKEGRVAAVLMVTRGVEKAYQLLSLNAFANAGVIMLTDYDGDVIVKRWNVPRESLSSSVNFLGDDRRLDPSVFGPGYDLTKDGQWTFKDGNGRNWMLAQHVCLDHRLTLLYAAPADKLLFNLPSLRWQNSAAAVVASLLILVLIGYLIWLEKAYFRKLSEVELTDALTHGDNMVSFIGKAQKLLAKSPDTYALVALDINRFKVINDTYGVTRGNQLLKLAHEVFSGSLVSDELCARYGADTFLLLLNYSGEERIRERLDRMTDEVMQRKHTLSIYHKYGFSVGVYVIRDKSLPPYIMVDHANFARKQCKDPQQPALVFYDDSVQEKLRMEAELLNAFPTSLVNGEFEIWLQPKVNIRTDIVSGAEVLVRWNHPELGFLSPARFLPVLEQRGHVVDLDLWVFEEVCRLLARWDREGREIVPLAVNLSRAHLNDDGFLTRYLKIIHEYGVNPHWIELELTESLFMENEEHISQIFFDIRSHGLRCAIDDFGTGYSSLSLLRSTSLDTVKLDRSFFMETPLSEQSMAVIRSITQLAEALGLSCVAEGVEDRAVVEFLATTECDIVQGYLYSRPLNVQAFEAFTYTAEKRRRLLGSDFVDGDHHLAPIRSLRSEQMRRLLSGLGHVGAYVVKKDSRELLFCNDYLRQFSPDVKEGMFCHDASSVSCAYCPLPLVENGMSPTIVKPTSSFGCPASMTAVEILWEDHIPAYAITLVPLDSVRGAAAAEEEEEEEVFRLHSEVKEWKKKASQDGLTRLLTKAQFEAEAARRMEGDKSGVLFFIDLDGFKQVNDSYGHLMGDEVLRNTAERIRLSFRKDDLIGRYGGDEFVVYASMFTDAEILERRLTTLKNMLGHPHTLDDVSSTVSASIGVARFPEDADSFNTLVSKADIALYEAKRRGKDQHVYYSDKLMPSPEK